MQVNQLSEEMWKLLFGVQRSTRYHDRRRRFFDLLHTSTSGFSLILGSAAFAALAEGSDSLKETAMIAAALVTVLASFDMVIGYAQKAREHSELKRRFIDLESEITMNASDAKLGAYKAKRLEIESDEPPKMHALDALCHFELAKSYGITEEKKGRFPGFFKRRTAQIFAWA